MTDTTTQEPYTITEYRDGKGREWVLDRRGRWYSSFPADVSSREDLIEGSADWFYGTLGELVAARGELTPLAVDNVEALLSTCQAVCDQQKELRDEIEGMRPVVDAAFGLAYVWSINARLEPGSAPDDLRVAVEALQTRMGRPLFGRPAPEAATVGDSTSAPIPTLPGPPEDRELRKLNRLIDESMVAHVASLDEPKDGTDG